MTGFTSASSEQSTTTSSSNIRLTYDDDIDDLSSTSPLLTHTSTYPAKHVPEATLVTYHVNSYLYLLEDAGPL